MLGIFYLLATFIGNFFPFYGFARDAITATFVIIIILSIIRAVRNISGNMKKKF